MIGKISLYDFIAAVIPGVLFIWGVSLLTSRIEISLVGGLAETSVLIVLAYVVGLMMQGIGQIATEKALLLIWGGFPSARMLLSSDSFFTAGYKTRLLGLVEGRFALKPNEGQDLKEQLRRNQEIFYLCYNAVDREKMSERPLLFNAHYGLFRCLLTSFLILLVIDVVCMIAGCSNGGSAKYELFALALVGAPISYLRARKRAIDFARSVYDCFIASFDDEKSKRPA